LPLALEPLKHERRHRRHRRRRQERAQLGRRGRGRGRRHARRDRAVTAGAPPAAAGAVGAVVAAVALVVGVVGVVVAGEDVAGSVVLVGRVEVVGVDVEERGLGRRRRLVVVGQEDLAGLAGVRAVDGLDEVQAGRVHLLGRDADVGEDVAERERGHGRVGDAVGPAGPLAGPQVGREGRAAAGVRPRDLVRAGAAAHEHGLRRLARQRALLAGGLAAGRVQRGGREVAHGPRRRRGLAQLRRAHGRVRRRRRQRRHGVCARRRQRAAGARGLRQRRRRKRPRLVVDLARGRVGERQRRQELGHAAAADDREERGRRRPAAGAAWAAGARRRPVRGRVCACRKQGGGWSHVILSGAGPAVSQSSGEQDTSATAYLTAAAGRHGQP
ncbi:uncharacterized protein V1510DRAFT_441865, partial [Dipodascopsis tothii]|uniref:uncharacterized protein n=1 Tax=Dipodascopsis tothii TaxID=44089 RepID=UPI0034CDD935